MLEMRRRTTLNDLHMARISIIINYTIIPLGNTLSMDEMADEPSLAFKMLGF